MILKNLKVDHLYYIKIGDIDLIFRYRGKERFRAANGYGWYKHRVWVLAVSDTVDLDDLDLERDIRHIIRECQNEYARKSCLFEPPESVKYIPVFSKEVTVSDFKSYDHMYFFCGPSSMKKGSANFDHNLLRPIEKKR